MDVVTPPRRPVRTALAVAAYESDGGNVGGAGGPPGSPVLRPMASLSASSPLRSGESASGTPPSGASPMAGAGLRLRGTQHSRQVLRRV
jgi:hypothetical protein